MCSYICANHPVNKMTKQPAKWRAGPHSPRRLTLMPSPKLADPKFQKDSQKLHPNDMKTYSSLSASQSCTNRSV